MNTPHELTQLRQWCNWKPVNGTKLPITPSGMAFRSNDPSTFASYDEASVNSNIAFVIQGDDPYTGIDLDDCLDENGKLREWAVPIVSRLDGLSFGEISPSGRGIKFLTRAKKPNGARCVHKFDDGQVEVYDFNRFWTITGCTYARNTEIGDGQQAVDWICNQWLTTSEPVQHATVPIGSSDLMFRAESYVDGADIVGTGGRNNAAFRLAGHLFAMVDDDGQALSESEIVSLMHRWNWRNPEPLTDREIEKVTESARKNGTPRQAKRPEARVESTDGVDLSGILGGNKPKRKPPRFERFPTDCLRPPGMISQIIDYTLATSFYPQPELALAGAIALMATVTGRKVESEYGTRTNCYILGLAPSGAGKEAARKTNKEILVRCGAEELLGPERVASSAGLSVQVAQRLSPLFQLDEIGRLLATMKNPGKSAHLYNIGSVLMQMYSSSNCRWVGDAYADTKKTPVIDQPHPVIYGTSIPESFWGNLTMDNLTDGLLGRMMVFEAPGYTDMARPERREIPGPLIDALSWWVSFNPTGGNLGNQHPQPIVATHEPDALIRYETHLRDINGRLGADNDQQRALWSRSGEKVSKLALIFACSRQAFTKDLRISIEDVNLAIRISNWMTRRTLAKAEDHVSYNETEAEDKRALRILDRPMTKNEFGMRTRWLNRRRRDELINIWQELGIIAVEVEETSGRPKVILSRT